VSDSSLTSSARRCVDNRAFQKPTNFSDTLDGEDPYEGVKRAAWMNWQDARLIT